MYWDSWNWDLIFWKKCSKSKITCPVFCLFGFLCVWERDERNWLIQEISDSLSRATCNTGNLPHLFILIPNSLVSLDWWGGIISGEAIGDCTQTVHKKPVHRWELIISWCALHRLIFIIFPYSFLPIPQVSGSRSETPVSVCILEHRVCVCACTDDVVFHTSLWESSLSAVFYFFF